MDRLRSAFEAITRRSTIDRGKVEDFSRQVLRNEVRMGLLIDEII